MLARHLLGLTAGGMIASGATAVVAAGTLIADTASNTAGGDLGAVVTGGGALGLTGVLGFIALKLSRGELVVRDVAAVETALLRVADERKAESAEARRVADASNALTREAVEVLALATKALEEARRP